MEEESFRNMQKKYKYTGHSNKWENVRGQWQPKQLCKQLFVSLANDFENVSHLFISHFIRVDVFNVDLCPLPPKMNRFINDTSLKLKKYLKNNNSPKKTHR